MIEDTWVCLELDPYFHSCWEQVPETWTKGSSVNSLSGRVFGHTYSLASIQWSRLCNQWTLLLTANCLHAVPEMEPEEWFLYPFVQKRREMADQDLATKTATTCTPRVHHVVTLPTHLPHPTFFAGAKPVFETDIAPTDNVRPKLHDKYARHQWLKG